MAEVIAIDVQSNIANEDKTILSLETNKIEHSDSSDDGNVTRNSNSKRLKRIQRLSDSDSDSESENKKSLVENDKADSSKLANTSSSGSETEVNKRSRIRTLSSGSESNEALSPSLKVSRTEAKQTNLKNKFKSLLKRNEREKKATNNKEHDNSKSSSESDDDINSIDRIKQKIQERNNYLKSTIYDPDTSDEDNTPNHQKSLPNKKKERKSAKLISPKPMRMTAKDAMENMQKIKSESNRMLREKEVSLPYHRPKALSLKDIMSKRRPALAADGKALPIKMNEEQLKQYVKMLEERQKEVIELCKSDSEVEDDNENDQGKDSIEENDTKVQENNNSCIDIQTNEEAVDKTMDETSDDLYDDLQHNKEQSNKDSEENTIKESENLCHINNNVTPEKEAQQESLTEQQTMETSVEDNTIHVKIKVNNNFTCEVNTESDSQLMILNYTENNTDKQVTEDGNGKHMVVETVEEKETTNIDPIAVAKNEDADKTEDYNESIEKDNGFSDDDINMDEIDDLIENSEIMKDAPENPLNVKPKLTGAPGTVIDLDDIDDTAPKNLSGVELLKERYIFFSKLKTPEEKEREKEQRIKPGMLHLKLKQELEDKMAEQRSLEWSKRLEEEKMQKMEVDAVMGEDEEDDIEKLESKLEQEAEVEEDNSESEEEPVEDDCDMNDKPKKRNPMLDDEAEVSDDENNEQLDEDAEDVDNDEAEADNESEDSSDESSESEDELEQSKPKKGRIIKAFEDSDDEDTNKTQKPNNSDDKNQEELIHNNDSHKTINNPIVTPVKNSQDDEIQLAQVQRSFSEDLFTSQSSGKVTNPDINILPNNSTESQNDEKDLGTQTFSIAASNVAKDKDDIDDNFSMTCEPQNERVEPEVAQLLEDLPQNLDQHQVSATQSQGFGDDVLALCTGNFFDNKFVSQMDAGKQNNKVDSQDEEKTDLVDTIANEPTQETKTKTAPETTIKNCDVLKSILNELDSPEFDEPRPNKFFTDHTNDQIEGNDNDNQMKKKFVIDSDDEGTENTEVKKKKKKKKKRMEKRALQISDDEDEDLEDEEGEYESEIDDDDEEKIVEYDSEENEVVAPLNPSKPKPQKRKPGNFFEDEAELSSNEEWSGDEDERGLDAMEAEEGDQEVFHQGRLRGELGKIHMREVLDQDKREVRMIQELLFEDGDLGDGHRQRRFRWRDNDGVEIDYSTIPIFSQSQDDDVENEEEWRKQRYERENFLRKMREKAENDDVAVLPVMDDNIKVNMTAVAAHSAKDAESEKKTSKDIPSPRKPFGIFQPQHRSLLSRGSSSLSRLAALAPVDGDSANLVTNSRNFVFAAQTDEPKAPKRKAANEGTPRLIKKLKSEQNTLRNSLLDHLNP